MIPGRLDGRVAIITGGARGQGASHVERLAREGATVIGFDALDAAGEETAERLRADGLDVSYRLLDVSDPAGWNALVTDCPRLDVLVNNAGIIHVSPLIEETLTPWNGLFAVNATGTLLRHAGRDPGDVGGRRRLDINVASIFGVTGSEGYVAYTASEAAIIAMTKTAALEHAADGIRVNAICPGGVSTPMNENEPEGRRPAHSARPPSARQRDLRRHRLSRERRRELRHRDRARHRRRLPRALTS